MGKQGYKSICEIGNNLYLINDDGNHIILLCKIIQRNEHYESYIQIIAGQKGI